MTEAPMSSADFLAWWRTLPAYELRKQRRELLSRLVELTSPVTNAGLIGRALAGETAVALIIVEGLDDDAHPDLAGSWIAWAAASGDQLAALVLTELLDVLLWTARGVYGERFASEPGAVAAMEERLNEWRQWLHDCSFRTPEGRARIAALLARQSAAAAPPEVTRDEDAAPGTRADVAVPRRAAPTRRIIARIGQTSGRESREIVEAYKVLTEPLPLAGGGLDPDRLAAALELEFPWMAEAAAAVRDDLALRRMAGLPWFRLSPMLLVGPPGIGKTRFARRLARVTGTGYGELSVAGASDNRMLLGTARGWSSAQPAYPLVLMRSCRTANPVVVIDEIDKATASKNGDIRATLLTLLERDTARTWFDECLLGTCDLGEISWILTANDLEPLPPALLSRLRIARVEAPAAEHFETILEAVLRDVAAELDMSLADLPHLEPQTVAALRNGLARRPDVRRLGAAVRRALARSAGRGSSSIH